MLNYNKGFPPGRNTLSLEQELMEQRARRIREIEALGYRAYGCRYEFTHSIPEILAAYGESAA